MSRVIFYSNFKMNGHNLACFQKNTRWLIVIKHKQSARIKRKNNKLVLFHHCDVLIVEKGLHILPTPLEFKSI